MPNSSRGGVPESEKSNPPLGGTGDEEATVRSTSKRAAPCVLLPTDFQQPARRAFSYAIKLAGLLGVRMELLHVIKVPSDISGPPPDSRYLRSMKTAALLDLGRLARMAGEAGVQVEPSLQFGVPSGCIVGHATRPHVGMVVMGTEGRTGWDRLRLGSTAQAVVSRAPCPVLAVHGGLAGDVVRHPARVKLDRLLAATDFSDRAQYPLEAVFELARLTRGRVCVVHVTSGSAGKHDAERKLRMLIRRLRPPGLEVDAMCLQGEPIKMILSQAAGWEADMIAVGTKGRRGLSRLIVGSVADGVLRRAGCPVLVVKRALPLSHTDMSHGRSQTS